jgi:alkylation response protein AidB-like acyl-CoA dehydrogenase
VSASVFNQVHEDLRAAVRALLEDVSNEAHVRQHMESEEGFDPRAWSAMAEMGLLGLGVPEELGGSGGGPLEIGIVGEEAGRALLVSPWFSTVVLAATALVQSGDDLAVKEHLSGICSGQIVATVAAGPDIAVRARSVDGEWVLDGTAEFVLDGRRADLILVAAQDVDGSSLFAVSGRARGLERTALPTLDMTRKQASLTLDNVPAQLIGGPGEAPEVLRPVLRLAAAVIAAEQAGGAARVLEMTVAYAKERHQFGRPIGSFQAIKHHCAGMLVQVDSATSAAHQALKSIDDAGPEADLVSSLAKAWCSDAYYEVSEMAIQVHGGIGFTWEHPAHLYFKRARSSSVLFGDARHHRELVAQHIGV